MSEAARVSLIRRAKAIHRKFALRRQQESFAGMMGPAGSQGGIGLADGGVAIEVGGSGYTVRRGAGFKGRRKRRLRGAGAPGCRRARAKAGRKRGRESLEDKSEFEQSSSEGGDDDDGGSARGVGQRPSKRSAREPAVGDRIRVFWTEEVSECTEFGFGARWSLGIGRTGREGG